MPEQDDPAVVTPDEETIPATPPDGDDRTPEDPSRFPVAPQVEPLDEAPEGRTPADTTRSDEESLPPGA